MGIVKINAVAANARKSRRGFIGNNAGSQPVGNKDDDIVRGFRGVLRQNGGRYRCRGEKQGEKTVHENPQYMKTYAAS